MKELNSIIHGNNIEVLKTFPDDCIDLTVTSPPYDLMRSYKGKISSVDYNGYSFPFEELSKQLFRVTKNGGVVVWVVNDGTDNGSKTGSSLKQALFFKECGFNIHDYMFYEKNGCNFPSINRYYQITEFMFILSKGKPKTTRLIKDRKNNWAGYGNWGKKTQRSDNDDDLIETKSHITPEYGARFNIWRYNTGKGFSTKDEIAFKHPAIFPEELARDHIISWSNVGEIVLDPFMGSGTTAKMAKKHKRNFIGIEINQTYIDIANERISNIGEMNDNYSDEIFINSLIEKNKNDLKKKDDIIDKKNCALNDMFGE